MRCILLLFTIVVVLFSVNFFGYASTEDNPSNPAEKEISAKPEEEIPINDVRGDEEEYRKYRPEIAPILKQTGSERIGSAYSYETYQGLRFGKYFTAGERVEIFQEAKPIDSYILDGKAMRILYEGQPWDTHAHLRSQIVPQFTRAYATEIAISDPDDPEGQIRYTHDYRDIYKQYYPKYPNIKVERWDQNEILLIHSKKIPGIDWYYTSNLGYRYSTIDAKGDEVADEARHTYIASLALAPSARMEWFGKFEYYKSMRIRSPFHYRPDHFYYRTELRMKSLDLKTSVTPAFSYSVDYYFPFKDTFKKYEGELRVGRDFTSRWSGTSTFKWATAVRDVPDNTAPIYDGVPRPYKDKAIWAGVENRLSYNIWNNFFLQGGADYSAGLNMSDFDNWGSLMGVEYYRAGVLRANFFVQSHHYYNINDLLWTLGFKVYVFI